MFEISLGFFHFSQTPLGSLSEAWSNQKQIIIKHMPGDWLGCRSTSSSGRQEALALRTAAVLRNSQNWILNNGSNKIIKMNNVLTADCRGFVFGGIYGNQYKNNPDIKTRSPKTINQKTVNSPTLFCSNSKEPCNFYLQLFRFFVFGGFSIVQSFWQIVSKCLQNDDAL